MNKFLLFISITVSFQLFAQNKYEPLFEKIEKAYEKGDYKVGLKYNNTLLKNIENDKSINQLTLARVLYLLAKGEELMGNFPNYDANMIKANAALSRAPKNDPYQYAKCIMYAIDTYLSFGDYANASKFIKNSDEVLSQLNSTIENQDLIYDIKTRQVNCLFKQGFHIKALSILPEIEKYRFSRIVAKEERIDPKTNTKKMVSVSKYNQILRKRSYAMAMNLKAEIYLENGKYKSADSLLTLISSWIQKNISKKDFSYVENMLLRGRLAEEFNDYKNANKYYEQAYKNLLKTNYGRYKTTSREAIEVYSYLIPTYKFVNKSSDYRKKRRVFSAKVQRYYGPKSYYHTKVEMCEINLDMMEGDWERVIEQSKELMQDQNGIPNFHLDRANLYDILNYAFTELDQYDQALGALDNSMEIKSRLMGEESPVFHMQKLEKANYLVLYTDDFKDAEDIYAYSFDQIIKKEMFYGHRDYLNYQYQYSKLYEISDRFDKANALIVDAMSKVQILFGKESVQYATVLAKKANIDIYIGKYNDASTELTNSLILFKNLATARDNIEYASALETQARLYIIQGYYIDAEKNLKKAYKMSKRSGKMSIRNSSLEELAILYIHIGMFQETEKNLKTSIEFKEKRFGKESRALINPLNQLGYLNYIVGDYTTAEKYALRAMALSKQIFNENSVKYAESLKLYANIHTAIGDYATALQSMSRVIEIYKLHFGENHIQVANALNDLALIRFNSKSDPIQVEADLLKSLSIIKINLDADNPVYADVLRNLCLFYLETGKYELSEKSLEEAHEIWRKIYGAKDRHAADYFYLKGMLYYKRKQFYDAKETFEKSKEIYETSFSKNHPDYTKALAKSGQMSFILKQYDEAIRIYNETIEQNLFFIKDQFPSLSEREKSKYWSFINIDFEFYYSMVNELAYKRPELIAKMYDMQMATKAILLSSSLKIKKRILNSGNKLLIDNFVTWQNKKELLLTLQSMSAEQLTASGQNIETLKKEIEAIEKYLSETSEEFVSAFEKDLTISYKTLSSQLKPNEAAIEIVRFRKFTTDFTDTVYYAALILSKESKYPKYVNLSNGLQLENKFLKYYRNAIRYDFKDEYSYKNYWLPIANELPNNINTLYVAADGVYNQINLETIHNGSSYLIEKFNFINIANTKDIIENKQKTVAKNNLYKNVLIGNPLFYSNNSDTLIKTQTWKQLPGAQAEISNIETIFKNNKIPYEKYQDVFATEEVLKSFQNPKILHIATHGYFLPNLAQSGFDSELSMDINVNPLYRSGLLLVNGGELMNEMNVERINDEDGVLTAYEAMNLNLDETELVVLSACETGLGEVQLGEGVFGLQRSFIVAGSKNLIMSLFKVNDDVTNELMSEFYKGVTTHGNKRKAFNDAKLSILKKYNNRLYWGAFVLVGLD
jgi:CHAT domain-containing protein/Flp pilus assembly protein TadD